MPQINLYYTNQANLNNTNSAIQYNCLYILVTNDMTLSDKKILSYCMNEYSIDYKIEDNNFNSIFTFDELAEKEITSEQLYLWSAPIDLIEQYQIYLEEKNVSLSKIVYMNCTLPRFGLQCQYEFDLNSYYLTETTNLTCYIHLECNRRFLSTCLDWTDICDGIIDCPENGIDEKDCLQLEINQCKSDEYRCSNGQCISKVFHKEQLSYTFDCIDKSDETMGLDINLFTSYETSELRIKWNEDVRCDRKMFTSSCDKNREDIFLKLMFSVKSQSIHSDCWSAFKDLIHAPDMPEAPYRQPCYQMNCLDIIEKYCPDILFIPHVPVLFNEIYFAYQKIDVKNYYNIGQYSIHYICTNNSRYDNYFKNYSKLFFNNQTCFRPVFQNENNPFYIWSITFEQHLRYLFHELNIYNLIMNFTSTIICNQWHMYQCLNSTKCISIYRIQDSFYDCPYKDDEDDYLMNNTQIIEKLNQTHFKCSSSNRYISYLLVDDNSCHCETSNFGCCDDEKTKEFSSYKSISFQTICDGFTQLSCEKNQTDETECQYWPCNNIYTRCNGFWDCSDGMDEIGCLTVWPLNCSSDYHTCISLKTYQFECLSKEKVLDGNIDCVGGTDEPIVCRFVREKFFEYQHKFYCLKNSSKLCLSIDRLCDGKNDCDDGSDENFCTIKQSNISFKGNICWDGHKHNLHKPEIFFCQYLTTKLMQLKVDFKLDYKQDSTEIIIPNKLISNSPTIHMSNELNTRCNYGVTLKIWLYDKNNSTKMTCLCPPNYYGNTCQYQNQRVTLAIQFSALSDSLRTVFAIIISLIDNSEQRIIHSYEQITFVSLRDCRRKYRMYFQYAIRSKDLTKNYYFQIDFYEKFSLKYRGSILFPIEYSFLPVQRLALNVEIPKTDDKQRICSNKKCSIHGKCTKYANQDEEFNFCRCDPGWSGEFCTIQYISTCSSNSFNIGITFQNQSICICPMHKFGSRCLLRNNICQLNSNSLCHQHGFCLVDDDKMIYNKTFTCICSNGYHGKYCELIDRNFTLIFEKNILTSQNLFIHLFQLKINEIPLRSTLFRSLFTQQNSISIQWSLPFHMIFIEIEKKYYLTYINSIYNYSSIIIQTVQSSNRCQNLNELFNKTFLQLNLLHRIKYYHLLCQNLSCFYDEKHLCLCQKFFNNHQSNCFEFDHNMEYNCLGQTECENNASCLHDKSECPTRAMCICKDCFYGRRCQFSTKDFSLSLDAILGYHILPQISINHQPFIVQFSLIITIIFLFIGYINGILCLITFKNAIILEVGCGLYLLCSSITSQLIMIIFAWKYLILLLTQMKIFSKKIFLLSQCYSIDFLLRICLLMDQWLNTCVSIERTIITIKGTNFNKIQSRKIAKYVILFLIFIIIITSIHDPFYRDLIIEQNDIIERIWCIVKYNSSMQFYNSIIQSIHFLSAFIINIFSAILLIFKKTRQQQIIHPGGTFYLIFQDQIKKHRHILISPLILIILAIPRLIIIYTTKCMQSINDSWFYLIGYLISFIPSMLTFIIFILPSKFYKKQFGKTIRHYRFRSSQILQFVCCEKH